MSHNIQEKDVLYLAGQPAWHGLGVVVPEAIGPAEAMKIAGLDWTVSMRPVAVDNNVMDDYKAIRRDDTGEIFKIFSDRYEPVQNKDFFDLAYSLGKEVKMESAGSLGNGRKVFGLMRTDSTFAVGKNDEVVPYIALMTSHDGSLRLSALPTSVRVVCENTLNMALRQDKKKFMSVKHTTTVQNRLETMREILASYDAQLGEFKHKVEALDKAKIKTDKKLIEFYTRAYLELYGAPDKEKPNEKLAMDDKILGWQTKMETESTMLGLEPSYWLAANSITQEIQHGQPKRKTKNWEEKRMESNFIGKNDDLSAQVFNIAMGIS